MKGKKRKEKGKENVIDERYDSSTEYRLQSINVRLTYW